MRSEIGIDIDAPPEVVFALAREVTRWADLLPHYLRSRAIRRDADGRLLVEFVARRGMGRLPGAAVLVGWRALTWSEPDALRLRFLHRGGATGGMDVTWRIELGRDGHGSRVTIEHAFPAPPAWAAFVDRFFTSAIAGQTLATFRAIAEAVETSGATSHANQPA